MEAAFGYGFKEGFIVPYHFRDDFGTPYSAFCAFYWNDAVKYFKTTLTTHHLDLHLIVIYFMHRMFALRAAAGSDQIPLRSIGRPSGSLTDRERDVLAWAARGKTSEETAAILNLSELTVDTHIRNALLKLNASNRTHAVAKSLAWGLIDL